MKNITVKNRAKAIQAFGKKAEQAAKEYWGPSQWLRLAIFMVSWLAATVILACEWRQGMDGHEFMVGEPSPRTLFSPLELTYVNEAATEALRREEVKKIKPVFKIEDSVFESSEEKIGRFFAALESVQKSRQEGKPAEPGQLPFEISEPSLKFLLENTGLAEVKKIAASLLERALAQGVVDYGVKLQLGADRNEEITTLHSGKETKVRVAALITPDETSEFAHRFLPPAVNKNRRLRNAILDIFNAVLVSNLIPGEEETETQRKKAAASVAPVYEQVKKDELLIQRGMLITATVKGRLDLVQKKLAKRKVLNQLLAAALLAGLTFLLLFIYLNKFQKKTASSLHLILLLHIIFLVTLSLSKIAAIWPASSFYLMPTALAPLLIVFLINAPAGFLGVIVISVLAAPLAGFNGDWFLSALASGLAGVFGALQVRKRIHFLRVGLAVGISSFLTLLSYRFFEDYPLADSLQVSALGLANGFLITLPLCFFLLPLLEWLFDLTTDITLLEISDLNHPLLKRMIVEAPGTYHHSLVVSTLAEYACQAIGANALLARVGCYFHDIGKIPRAEFFTENQSLKLSNNRHEKLAPTLSSLVIKNHVKDGLELGRQYKLRKPILQFIPEHQGTGIVYYFYRKALDYARPGEKINPEHFRYPGPKPQSRETAVALLADSTEAASRSLKDPSPESIRQLVRKIINDRFVDGQLDECDLTLRDLHKIQESFVYNLMAIFHTRVGYPSAPQDQNKPDLFAEDQFDKFRISSPRR